MENLLKIAKVSKSDGTGGAVIFSFLSFEPDDLEISEPVFVHFDGLPVPFFIESFTRRGNSRAVVRLNDIRSFEDAEELVGREVYVADDGEGAENLDLVGWTVKTVSAGGTAAEDAGGTAPGNDAAGANGTTSAESAAGGADWEMATAEDAAGSNGTASAAGNPRRNAAPHRRKGNSPAAEVLGTVSGFLDIPGNPCIEVTPADGAGSAGARAAKTCAAKTCAAKRGAAVIIPLHEDFIVSADPESRTLVMSLPEGLL